MACWTVKLEGGPRRVNHAAVAIGEKIYSFGGYCTGDDYETVRPIDVHILDTVSYRWKKHPISSRLEDEYIRREIPYLRYGHTAVPYEECAYIWGGRNDSLGACKVLFCFNTFTLKWNRVKVNGITPAARDGHSATVLKDQMYIYGGYEEWIDRFSNDIHIYRFATSTWSCIEPSGTPAQWRDFASVTCIGDTLYVFGGRSDQFGPFHTNNEVYCNKIQSFNILTEHWSEPKATGHIPCGRRSHSAFVYGEQLYIFGGYNGIHNIHFSDLYKFDPATSNWSLVNVSGNGPCARRRQCCCVIKDRVFMFGGTSPSPGVADHSEQDLTDHSDLYVLDFSPSLKTLCEIAVLENNLDTTLLPQDIQWELKAMTTNNTITRSTNNSG